MHPALLIQAGLLSAMTPQTISTPLKSRRTYLHITQAQLATLTGIGIATIKRFESGTHWINMKQYTAICECLGVEITIMERKKDNI